ncbi:MAG: DUF4294 domain-containing protein [Flavobacteriaceae bacterium]|nr:DUF4294 domain-containing protein [Flavobacteriaceae bacterium]MCY4217569.1 DUF4294 domain-containing protein [Flavobacteriaceae bacterium]MCY4254083.1 DUF4294 domain-containing protein [Flavobacteriaceae bacterium]
MLKRAISVLFLLFIHSHIIAQVTDEEYEGERLDTLDYWDDELGLELEAVTLFQPLKFQTQDELRNYLILRNRTLKVYPYAKLAGERLEVLINRLEQIDKKSQRKTYIKRVEKHIFNELEEELKNLSRSQGRILIRLVYRQTGFTAFDLVKDLRSGFRAFIFQTTASLFNLTLKSEFDPLNNKEDYMIEYILQRAHADGIIELQSTPLEYDLDMLYTKWNEPQRPT